MSLTNPTTPTELLADERHRYLDGREKTEALHAELMVSHPLRRHCRLRKREWATVVNPDECPN